MVDPADPPARPEDESPEAYLTSLQEAVEAGLDYPPPSSELLATLRPEVEKVFLEMVAEIRAAARRPASRFPGYQVVGRRLGRGGRGIVYRARELGMAGRYVALKTVLPDQTADPASARQILREAHIAARFDHPNIPPVHAVGADADGVPFYTRRLVSGVRLSVLLDRRSGAGDQLGRFLLIFAQACRAVAHAHSRGFVHLDLKPQNILVEAADAVQVVDWGSARQLGAGGPADALPAESAAAAGSAAVGTPEYMAPEQATRPADELTPAADVFSLGAILCQVLTRSPPYPPSRDNEPRHAPVNRADLAGALARLGGCGPQVDPDLVELAKQCLAVKPADRPDTAGPVADRVAAALARADERAAQAERDRERMSLLAGEQRRRDRLLMVSIGAVAAVILVFGSVALWQRASALTARDAAANAANDAQSREAETRRLLDLRRLTDADLAWREGLFDRSRRELDEVDESRRGGLSWRLLDRRCSGLAGRLGGGGGAVLTVRAARDGRTVTTVCEGGAVRVWDLRTGAEVVRGYITPSRAAGAALFPDGRQVAVPEEDDGVGVWDLSAGRVTRVLGPPLGPVECLEVSDDGGRVVACGDGWLRAWDAATGREVFVARAAELTPPIALALSRSGHVLATATAQGVRVWDGDTGRGRRAFATPSGTKKHPVVALTPDGQTVLTTGPGHGPVVTARNVDSGEATVTTRFNGQGPVEAMAVAPDGARVAALFDVAEVGIFDWESGSVVGVHHLVSDRGGTLSFTPDGSQVLAGQNDVVRIVDTRDALQLDETPVVGGAAEGGGLGLMTLSADGTRVAGVWRGRLIRVWDTDTRALIGQVGIGARAVTCVALDATGGRLAATLDDGTLLCWEPATGKSARVPGAAAGVQLLLFAKRGGLVALSDGVAVVLDPDTGARRANFPIEFSTASGGFSPAPAACVSADGSTLAVSSLSGPRAATGDRDAPQVSHRVIRLYRLSTGKALSVPIGHVTAPRAFTPDGRYLLTTDGNVFDVETGDEVVRLTEYPIWRGLEASTLSADGDEIVTVFHDGTLRTFDRRTGHWLARLHLWPAVSHSQAQIVAAKSRVVAVLPNGRVATVSTQPRATAVPSVSSPEFVVVAPDGSRAVAVVGDQVQLIDPATGQPICRLTGFKERVTGLCFVGGTARLAVVTASGRGGVYTGETGQLIASISLPAGFVPKPLDPRRLTDPTAAVAAAPDGSTVYVASDAGVWAVDAATGGHVHSYDLGGSLLSPDLYLWVSSDGSRLAAAGRVGEPLVWECGTARRLDADSAPPWPDPARTADGRFLRTGRISDGLRLGDASWLAQPAPDEWRRGLGRPDPAWHDRLSDEYTRRGVRQAAAAHAASAALARAIRAFEAGLFDRALGFFLAAELACSGQTAPPEPAPPPRPSN